LFPQKSVSKQTNSSEAGNRPAGQQIPRPNWKVHVCVHNSPLLVRVISLINPTYIPTPHFGSTLSVFSHIRQVAFSLLRKIIHAFLISSMRDSLLAKLALFEFKEMNTL
jgi:hypothetical protein